VRAKVLELQRFRSNRISTLVDEDCEAFSGAWGQSRPRRARPAPSARGAAAPAPSRRIVSSDRSTSSTGSPPARSASSTPGVRHGRRGGVAGEATQALAADQVPDECCRGRRGRDQQACREGMSRDANGARWDEKGARMGPPSWLRGVLRRAAREALHLVRPHGWSARPPCGARCVGRTRANPRRPSG